MVEELEEINQSLRNRDKLTISQLSLALQDLTERAERLGINVDNNNLILSEQEQIRDYLD